MTAAEYKKLTAKESKKKKPSKKFTNAVGTLRLLLKEKGLTIEAEHKGIPDRQFRFDYAIPALKIAIEYEGIIGAKSRHTTIGGYSTDCEKYNLATAAGWKVLRYTVVNCGNLVSQVMALLPVDKV